MNTSQFDLAGAVRTRCYRLARERSAQVQADGSTEEGTTRLGQAVALLVVGAGRGEQEPVQVQQEPGA